MKEGTRQARRSRGNPFQSVFFPILCRRFLLGMVHAQAYMCEEEWYLPLEEGDYITDTKDINSDAHHA